MPDFAGSPLQSNSKWKYKNIIFAKTLKKEGFGAEFFLGLGQNFGHNKPPPPLFRNTRKQGGGGLLLGLGLMTDVCGNR